VSQCVSHNVCASHSAYVSVSVWLRVLDSMQLTVEHKVATPANWKNGEDVIIVPAVSDDDAKEMFPDGWKTVKPYLRVVKQPK